MLNSMPNFRREYDPEIASHFKFKSPPECPVFEPSPEEFDNPIDYINSICHIGEKYGIIKIKPPADWQPPFAMDVDNFKFVPRIQRLNELEAGTRIKLNFLDQISKYWMLQGIQLKIPTVERKVLDLYELNDLVEKAGGLERLDKDRKWPSILSSLGMEPRHWHHVRTHYMKILHPYHIFRKENLARIEDANEDDVVVVKTVTEQERKAAKRPVDVITLSDDDDEDTEKHKTDKSEDNVDKKNISTKEEMEGEEYKPHGIESRQAIKPPSTKYRRTTNNCFIKQEPLDEEGAEVKKEDHGGDFLPSNRELAKLAFFGAGPKLSGYDPSRRSYESKTRGLKVDYKFDPLAKYTCRTCDLGDREESILLCDGCDASYHTHCLIPPLLEVPEGAWRCPQCVALEVGKPAEAFGFEQAAREYTLQQFGEVADTFKKNYFRMPVYAVPPDVVEKEYWRVVSCIDGDVSVLYGADLHTMDHGSGFPTNVGDSENLAMELEYSQSAWNLNNLPVCEGSVLQFIDSDISGMKVPWMYVGMCFATFCWHNEDHWNYSINYLHWGEAKTWYGVPGSQATLLEDVMKAEAPELFKNQPDLLQQLVTIMNPNILMNKKVQVVRTDQQAGEFVVTFPRAYHAGFNQGYNFAEAVNFAPANWLKVGRECIEHYRVLNRFCVFSHDELVVRMAERPERLTKEVAIATLQDMIVMCRCESDMRKVIKAWGVTEFVNYRFEDLADDERCCEVCKTTCYLSGVSCACKNGGPKHTCLKHYTQLCDCPPQKHVLRIRHHLDQLLVVVKRLKVRTQRP